MHDSTKQQRAIFLDRDGVINEVLTDRVKFVNKTSDLYLIPGAAKAIGTFNKMGFKVFVVTNQAGVTFGYMTQSELDMIHMKLKSLLFQEDKDAVIHEISACIHAPTENCICRKPNAGQLTNLAKKYNIDLKNSYMIGDMETDIEAGKKAGTQTILISSNDEETTADMQFSSLLELIKNNGVGYSCEKCYSEMKLDHSYSKATDEQRETLAPYEYCSCDVHVYKCVCGEETHIDPPEEYQCESCKEHLAFDSLA